MVRPRKCRNIKGDPQIRLFKPQGVPLKDLFTVVLRTDEVEALRLRDIENLNQTESAIKMQVSQSTLQRILRSAQKKVSQAIIQGWAIHLDQD